MAHKKTKIYIELYGDRQFQGYLKRIGRTKSWVESTLVLDEAKTYAKIDTAQSDIERVAKMTHGALTGYCTIG